MRAVAIHSLLLVGCVAMPCCGVTPQGVTVNFGHQKNIVVWDKVNRIEHFVRVSAFEGQTE
jgi:cysteinyl-tRNA synthetase